MSSKTGVILGKSESNLTAPLCQPLKSCPPRYLQKMEYLNIFHSDLNHSTLFLKEILYRYKQQKDKPMDAATAIANHLSVVKEAVLEVQEWVHVLWVRVKGIGCRFVSKKITENMKNTIDHKSAAMEMSKKIGGNFWSKKPGESRLYIGKGYLRFAPETGESSQVQYFLKTYDRTPEIVATVEEFNHKFQIVHTAPSSVSTYNLADFVSEAENEIYPGYGI